MPKVRRITTVIIGEGPTEYFYLNSLKDEFRELQNIKPDSPKNTSLFRYPSVTSIFSKTGG